MSINMVNAIASGNNIEAEDAIKKNIASKVGDALELKRREYSKTFLTIKPQEETDEVWKSLRNNCRERRT